MSELLDTCRGAAEPQQEPRSACVNETSRIAGCKILIGDCRDVLKTLPDESVHCCVTSPPYFGLRDYGVSGQIGLEPNYRVFISEIVNVFREVRRVLRNDGTLWLNLGDSYAGTGKSGGGEQGKRWDECGMDTVGPKGGKWMPPPLGLKQKDLMGIPWRVAFALQDDGWYLRSDIIWHKPNPMPESVTDRPTKSHEYIFLLTKSERYFYDAEAIKERSTESRTAGNKAHKYVSAYEGSNTEELRTKAGLMDIADRVWESRNKRTVWTVPTYSYSGAHFATYPPDLIRPCILAGCPIGGTVLDPFGGSGTTGEVSVECGRNAILIELNPEYADLGRIRTNVTPGLGI